MNGQKEHWGTACINHPSGTQVQNSIATSFWILGKETDFWFLACKGWKEIAYKNLVCHWGKNTEQRKLTPFTTACVSSHTQWLFFEGPKFVPDEVLTEHMGSIRGVLCLAYLHYGKKLLANWSENHHPIITVGLVISWCVHARHCPLMDGMLAPLPLVDLSYSLG